MSSTEIQRKPDWLKIQLNTTDNFRYLKKLMREERLNTVCEEARCPNIHECWGEHRTATFMILGDTCTRRCRFCAVKTGLPGAVDAGEPQRVGESVAKMALRHVVITMVNRDDLKDGGARIMAETVTAIHRNAPDCTVEVLTSDFMGSTAAVETVLSSEPAIFSHNLETIRRLTRQVRSRSDYDRSLAVLAASQKIRDDIVTKSSMMLGLGETEQEVLEAMDDLRAHGVRIINLGQYLQPSRTHLPVQRYWLPEEFHRLRDSAMEKGFVHCDAGPLVRSSYHAGEGYDEYRKKFHPLYRDDS
jgi:lipoic acid synthetase